MSSLADKIADKNERGEKEDKLRGVDELGFPIPTPETPQYWVARAIRFNNLGRETEPAIHLFHTREGVLYDGHQEVKETTENVYRYARLKHSIAQWEAVEFWRQIREHVPKLNRRFLDISYGLYWDLEEAELIPYKEVMRRIKNEA